MCLLSIKVNIMMITNARLVIVLIFLSSWIWNAIKFTSCDFESNFKCEAIHGIGLFVPFSSLITVWFDVDK